MANDVTEDELRLTWQVPAQGADDREHYPTPHAFKMHLLRYLDARGELIRGVCPTLDPCCGEGKILEAVRGYRPVHGMRLLGIEIDAVRATCAAQVADDVRIADALKVEWPAGAIVTNPPFTLALDFARRCVHQVVTRKAPFAAMLLRQTWLEMTRDRAAFLQDHPPTVLVFPEARASFAGKGKDMAPTHWFVWGLTPLDRMTNDGRRMAEAVAAHAEIAWLKR